MTALTTHDVAPRSEAAGVRLMGLDFAPRSGARHDRDRARRGHRGRGGWICPANLDVLRQWRASAEVRELVAACRPRRRRRHAAAVGGRAPGLAAPRARRRLHADRLADAPPPRTPARSIFLLGGNPGTADAAVAELTGAARELRLAGTLCPPFGFEQRPGVAGPDRGDAAAGGAGHRLRRPRLPQAGAAHRRAARPLPDRLVRLLRDLLQLRRGRDPRAPAVMQRARPRVAAPHGPGARAALQALPGPRAPVPRPAAVRSALVRFRHAAPDGAAVEDPMRVIRAKAPLRVSFAGGGTDVPPFPDAGGRARPQRDDQPLRVRGAGAARGRADRRRERRLRRLAELRAATRSIVFDGRLDLVKAAIRKLGRGGFDLFLHSNAPPGSGLGSSSAVMVALIGLLKEYHGRAAHRLRDRRARRSTSSARTSGSRAACRTSTRPTFGGFNFIEFEADRVIVNPLRISADVVHELEHNMLLCYTGKTRSSDHIIEDQTEPLGGRGRARPGRRCAAARSSPWR